MIRSLIKLALLASLVLLGVALWRSERLPPPSELESVLLDEPRQTPTHTPAFDTTVGDIRYTVKPIYEYDIVGLVVSRHDANVWWDYAHREWNDKLNVVDLCVVWGRNARDGAYDGIDFSSGQWTCNFSTSSQAAYEAFDPYSLSNNHLITDNTRFAEALRKVRVGDQIHIRGKLAEYSHNHGFAFHRGSSTTRRDTGNGACETIYIEDFEMLQKGGGPWRMLTWVAVAMLVLSLLAWFFQPAKFYE
ncbi:hypothetical protein VVD49_03065 [Uliginosibacterium sp. H3]|uniref:DUF4178 domain-containing protein n=1 Tax=Uliginosibacterium silvisoli TaxID=3114758 RepID=A0ABU6JZA2_9RHOO|nr:hypothetical protein [Uliginosibacterium sp. H3]